MTNSAVYHSAHGALRASEAEAEARVIEWFEGREKNSMHQSSSAVVEAGLQARSPCQGNCWSPDRDAKGSHLNFGMLTCSEAGSKGEQLATHVQLGGMTWCSQAAHNSTKI